MLLITFFVLGLVIGSFLNVCVYRIPLGKPLAYPPSSCPHCGKGLKARDLVPVLSYLALLGKCRQCGQSISPQYPLVELLTGLLFGLVFLRVGLDMLLIKYLFFTSLLIVVTFIDIEHYIIPDRLVMAGLAVGLVFMLLFPEPGWLSSLYGMLAAAGFLLLLFIVSRGGMGGGDIKLALVLGLFLGWPLSLLGVFLACLIAGVFGMALILGRRKKPKDMIPFGPFLALGSFLVSLWGNEIIRWYAVNFLHFSP